MTEPAGEYSIERCAEPRAANVLERCVEIIKAGRAVDIDLAKLRQASSLVAAKKGDGIVGAWATVKAVRPGYTARVAKKSGFPLATETAELGYVAVDEAHRGNRLSHRLVGELLRVESGMLFATTDNPYMKSVLLAAGFEQSGAEWKGTRGLLSLWVRADPTCSE